MKRLLPAGVFLGASLSACFAQIPPLTLYPMTADVILGTPCGSTGTPLWRSICSSDMTAVFGTANTWTALQTFSGGIALPSQTANTFLAGPNGSSGAPSFRAIAAPDIPAMATAQSSPSNPSGTTSTTGVMAGLAGPITPAGTGNVLIIIEGTSSNNTVNDGCGMQIRYGTGSAPSNGAALTGTAVGTQVQMAEGAASKSIPFSVSAIVTGLTRSTAYWVDLSEAAVTGGTCTLTNISISALEQ